MRMRTQALVTSLIWLSITHGNPEQKKILFSRGVKLVVNASGVKSGAPSVQILIPDSGQMETSKTTILTCIVKGLHTKVKDVTWKINDTVATHSDTRHKVFEEADATFSALAFYFVPVHVGKSDDVFRCEGCTTLSVHV
ncbi:uncharacterized protein LOC143528827 [Brachyhypopomus gauderio]|uniref:uncharacterized protein LOC143528827 n=1 Tax=Brachyhypopomus gauderio TaxID=698409 RepID=UPI00404165E8